MGFTDVSVSKLTRIAAFFGLSPGAILDQEEPGTDPNTIIISNLKAQLLLAEQQLVTLQAKLIELYERNNAQ
ncbi:hypothetical protein D3C86_1526810 [compost metagenome]